MIYLIPMTGNYRSVGFVAWESNSPSIFCPQYFSLNNNPTDFVFWIWISAPGVRMWHHVTGWHVLGDRPRAPRGTGGASILWCLLWWKKLLSQQKLNGNLQPIPVSTTLSRRALLSSKRIWSGTERRNSDVVSAKRRVCFCVFELWCLIICK